MSNSGPATPTLAIAAGDGPIRVLFVDDDPNVLSGLKRSMRAVHDVCDSYFCVSGEEGLALLAKNPVDVVVSDMRMPLMDGAAFLGRVQELYPSTVRIILSGYAAPEAVLRTVEPAHLYLAKPCTPEVLISAVTRPLALRRLLHSDNLRSTLAGLSTVPSIPKMFYTLEAELTSPNASAQSVAEIISHDVAMTAELLKLTNSAYFAVGSHVSTPLQAVRILGLETVQTLVLNIGIFRQFTRNGSLGKLMDKINLYAIRLGRLAQEIARAEELSGAEQGLAYCIGLLSTIGAIILLDSHGDRLLTLQRFITGPQSLAQAEEQAIGSDHWLVGAYLLGIWGFAEPLVEAVAYALNPSGSGATDNPLLTVLHAATALGPRFPLSPEGKSADSGWPIDMNHLVECRKERHLIKWQEIARNLKGEWGL